MDWTIEQAFQRNSKKGKISRPAFKDARGLVYLPPKNSKHLQPWFAKLRIPESLQTSYKVAAV